MICELLQYLLSSNKELIKLIQESLSEVECKVKAVSYTHLDVYKRQVYMDLAI